MERASAVVVWKNICPAVVVFFADFLRGLMKNALAGWCCFAPW